MSANADRIGLATADLWADITDTIYDVSPLPVDFGGFSQIHTGVWRSVYGEMKVAIKVIRLDTTTLTSEGEKLPRVLQREVSVWKKLVHRNIHIMCGFFKGFGSAPALVSPWYENGDVKTYVRRHATDPDVDMLKLKLLADAMTGLKFLHEHRIVHGDIKGGNVLISDDGVARLCDFGLSRLLEHSQSTTQSGVKGTLRWMAPELVLEEGARHSYASDMWACGCLCIEVWSNERPYHTKTNDQQVILALSREEPPVRPSNMTDALWTVVEGCCSFEAVRRPQPLQVVAHFSSNIVMQRVYSMVTLGRSIDSAGSYLLKDLETSLHTTDQQQLSELYILPDADLAEDVIRVIGLWSLSAGRADTLHDAVFQWCIAKLGVRNLHLPVGVSLLDVDDDDFIWEFSGLHKPEHLRRLARLLAQSRPGLADNLMTQFSTRALDPRINVDTHLSMAWFSDGNRIVVGCVGGTIRILDVATGATRLELVGHTVDIKYIAVSPNSRLVASCSNDKSIRLWDAETGLTFGAPLVGHDGWVWSAAFSPDGEQIVSGSDDKTIRVWSTDESTTVLGPLRGHINGVMCVAFSPDGSRIISGSWDTTICVWDAFSGDTILTFNGHTHSVQSVAYSPDGLRIVSGSRDSTVQIWDATTGQLVGRLLGGHSDVVLSVAYSSDGTRIIFGSNDRTIRMWDPVTGTCIATLRVREHVGSVCSVAFPPPSGWGGVFSVAFSPDGTRLASASWDSTVRIWDATDDWKRWDI